MDESTDLRMLFHQLNNQLGIILANAELLEAKTTDATNRARAAQLVTSALDAMGTELLTVSGCEPAQPRMTDPLLPTKRLRLVERTMKEIRA